MLLASARSRLARGATTGPGCERKPSRPRLASRRFARNPRASSRLWSDRHGFATLALRKRCLTPILVKMAVPDTGAAATTCGYAARDGQRRDRLRRADALRAPRRGARGRPRRRSGGDRDPRRARAGRCRSGRGRLRRDGPGAPGRAGQAPARQAAVGAGIPKEVPSDTINKVCASSVRALEIAELMVEAGRHEVVVTGGMESMSRAPTCCPGRASATGWNGEILDHMWSSTGSPRPSTGST